MNAGASETSTLASPLKQRHFCPVSIGEIQQLPLSEKLQIMEAIWEDLRLHADQVPVPQWHKDLLDVRRKAVDENREEILEWDEVKHSLGSTPT
jgi:putative addiction module component (TIGR02574 family)